MEIFYILDASAFINGFKITSKNNFTVPEITAEIKDFESRLRFDTAIEDNKLIIQDVPTTYVKEVGEIISVSGDVLRLSRPDKKLIALAYMLFDEESITGKKFARDVKRSMVKIIPMMTVKFAGLKFLKKGLR